MSSTGCNPTLKHSPRTHTMPLCSPLSPFRRKSTAIALIRLLKWIFRRNAVDFDLEKVSYLFVLPIIVYKAEKMVQCEMILAKIWDTCTIFLSIFEPHRWWNHCTPPLVICFLAREQVPFSNQRMNGIPISSFRRRFGSHRATSARKKGQQLNSQIFMYMYDKKRKHGVFESLISLEFFTLLDKTHKYLHDAQITAFIKAHIGITQQAGNLWLGAVRAFHL